MLRTSFSASDAADRPLYREIFPRAYKLAWREWRLWPLALLASILFTGGVFDVIYRGIQNIPEHAAILSSPTDRLMQGIQGIARLFQGPLDPFTLIGNLEFLLTVIIFLIALVGLSCIAQAGLIYGLASTERGQRPTLRAALNVGTQTFRSVALLTLGSVTLLWITRCLISVNLSLAISLPSYTRTLLYLASFTVFTAISFALTIVHIFALNAIVLQGAAVSEAIVRAYRLFQRHWIVCLETATLLFITVIGIGVVCMAIYLLCMIPLLAALIIAGTTQSLLLLYGTMGIAIALFTVGIVFVGAYATQVQYAVWTNLYRRFGEHDITSKLHRIIRVLTGRSRSSTL